MRKFFSTLLVLLMALLLVACKDTEEPTPTPPNGNGDNGQVDPDPKPDPTPGDAIEIVIMHGAPREVDPRRDDFTGDRQQERIDLIAEVEKSENVKISFVDYPEDAPWGSERGEAIVDWHLAGNKKADIYQITTDWLPQIADANALAPLDAWLLTHGNKIHDGFFNIASYDNQIWGFNPNILTNDEALFYNQKLVNDLGLDDPATLWNEGKWTWDKFEEWGLEAKSLMGEDQVPFSGMPSYYVTGLLPTLGVSVVNPATGNVEFNNATHYQVYDFIRDLATAGLFDENPDWDGKSERFTAGDAIFHPGENWFVNSEDRWAELEFSTEISAVPYPLPQGKTKDHYLTYISTQPIHVVAANPSDRDKEELAFKVWNMIQIWEDEEVQIAEYEDYMAGFLSTEASVLAMMDTFGKVKLDGFSILGIPVWESFSYQAAINNNIREDYRSALSEIVGSYQEAADEVFK